MACWIQICFCSFLCFKRENNNLFFFSFFRKGNLKWLVFVYRQKLLTATSVRKEDNKSKIILCVTRECYSLGITCLWNYFGCSEHLWTIQLNSFHQSHFRFLFYVIYSLCFVFFFFFGFCLIQPYQACENCSFVLIIWNEYFGCKYFRCKKYNKVWEVQTICLLYILVYTNEDLTSINMPLCLYGLLC